MPVIALAVAAWDLGLLAGFANTSGAALYLAALCCLGVAAAYRSPRLVGATLLATAALATGHSSRAASARLASTHTVAVDPRNAGALERIRLHAERAVDATFPRDAALVRALTLADTRDLPRATRDEFAAAGLSHFLAIAGLHVGLLVLLVESLLAMTSVSRRASSVTGFVVVVAYVAMIGFPIAAVRAAIMLGARAASRFIQRPTSPWSLLAIGSLQPVWNPTVVTQISYQLSVAGVAALIAANSLVKRLSHPRTRREIGLRKHFVRPLAFTTIASAATSPLVAWSFGRVSLVAPLTNLVAAPILAAVQPMLFMGLALAWLHPVARLVGDAAHPLLAALAGIAHAAAASPHAAVYVQPSPVETGIGCFAAACLITACAARHWQRPAVSCAAAVALLVWLPLAPTRPGLTELHVLDVGQGDAIALRTPHGHWILFDAGGAWASGDEGRAMVVPYIGRRGGKLDGFVLSHPHTDHVGGAGSVFDALHPTWFLDAAFAGPAGMYRAALRIAERDGVTWRRAHPGDSIAVDGVTLEILAPDSAWTSHLVDPNLASVVVRVRVGRVSMLLTGDAEAAEERWLLEHTPAGGLRADILKVGHHGSNTSSSADFLAAVAPSVAVISVGVHNHYGLPDAPVLRALAAAGARTYRTDQAGTVVVRTDGRTFSVAAEREGPAVRR